MTQGARFWAIATIATALAPVTSVDDYCQP